MADEKATYPQFTNLKLNEGLFDQLMATVNWHVQDQFKQQRITAADYAKVYLGALEAVLGNTTQYLLGGLLLEEQRLKIKAEIKMIELEQEKLRFEIDYMYPAQLIKLEQEGKLIEAQVDLANANILKTQAEVTKIEAEILMLESQKLLIDAQIEKINAEILYINAKIKTEEANTSENFTSGSLIGRQTALLKAQKLGFAGDLYIKQAKLHADYAAVIMSVLEPTNKPVLEEGTDAAGDPAKTVAGNIASIP